VTVVAFLHLWFLTSQINNVIRTDVTIDVSE